MSVLSLLPDDRRKDLRKESLETVYSSNSRLNLLNKRKRLNPLTDGMSLHSLNGKGGGGDRYVTQRVLSAKTHRVKALQNQLADAHYHLQHVQIVKAGRTPMLNHQQLRIRLIPTRRHTKTEEEREEEKSEILDNYESDEELSNENRVLRAIQKKQEIALQRYENSNAELPQVLNSHSEEIRIQQSKYKQLKQQFKEVTMKLKEKDLQLQQLKDEHQHLLELSKDRNLLEREKLQHHVSELTARVQQQNETISMLQRRITLEAKNFKHQLQNEINKHKDTRHDLDLAINNADKLSTIIEMKEKMLSTAASRSVKSPTKPYSTVSTARPVSRTKPMEFPRVDDRERERTNIDNSILAKLAENSRNISSSLSHEEDTSSSTEPRSRYARSRTNSTSTRSTPNQTRKSSKGSDDMIELAKTVQDGMAELAIFDDDIDFKNSSCDEVQKKIDVLKADLLNKLKTDETPSRKPSALRQRSTEESIEEEISEKEVERPKSRGRRNSNVSFYENVSTEESTTVVVNNDDQKPTRENSAIERKLSGKPVEKYCKDIIQDIEKSNKLIERHVKQFNSSRFESDQLVQQLQVVDKINDFVNFKGEIPEAALTELNNNFKMLTDQVLTDAVPVTRKRSISGRRNSRTESKTNLLDDGMSNQDLLEDLLGKK